MCSKNIGNAAFFARHPSATALVAAFRSGDECSFVRTRMSGPLAPPPPTANSESSVVRREIFVLRAIRFRKVSRRERKRLGVEVCRASFWGVEGVEMKIRPPKPGLSCIDIQRPALNGVKKKWKLEKSGGNGKPKRKSRINFSPPPLCIRKYRTGGRGA